MSHRQFTAQHAGLRVVFRKGALDALPDEVDALGAERVLLVTTEGRAAVADRAASLLSERLAARFDDATPHVPVPLAERAQDIARRARADLVLAVGGGSAIGVAKAVAKDLPELRVAAIPTTFSGSEMTDIYGLTGPDGKITGRAASVRPALVLYDPHLVEGMPLALAVTSGMNALAHAVEARYAQDVDPALARMAEDAIASLAAGLRGLVEGDASRESWSDVLCGAYLAGRCLREGQMGLHHKLAHVLGGRWDLPHAATHAALLPQAMAYNAPAAREASEAIARALGRWDGDAPGALHDLAVALDAPTRLVERFGPDEVLEASQRAVARPYANPAQLSQQGIARLLDDARLGRRPSTKVRRRNLGSGCHARHGVAEMGAPLNEAKVAVVALHGRGSDAETMAAFVLRALDEEGARGAIRPQVCVLAPQAEGRQWYPRGFMVPEAQNEPWLSDAIGVTHDVLRCACEAVGAARVLLVGFSQGACLALTAGARFGERLGGIVGLTGGLIGEAIPELPSQAGQRVLLASATRDPWVPLARFRETQSAFEAAGAEVEALLTDEDMHRIRPVEAERLRAWMGRLVTDALAPLYRPGESLRYHAGFRAAHSSEALPGALPVGQNSPRRPPYGLHAEQINGTGFTVRRGHNLRTWMYRVRPSVLQSDFTPYEDNPRFVGRFDLEGAVADPNLGRWAPLPLPEGRKVDFVDGMSTFAGAGDPDLRSGLAIHLYAANASMERRTFYNADGDLLVVPEKGALRVRTELGLLDVAPGQVLLLPKGIKASVGLTGGVARGYVLEVFADHFRLPERGPIGANGMSDERHFEAPAAVYDDAQEPWELVAKSTGRLWRAEFGHNPYDVVAWHGNYAPYRYDLRRYNAMGTVSFDHPDPSLLTVLTVPFDELGNNLADFVVFPGRWDVAEHSLRPPYFHRNAATEFNGIVSMRAPTRGFEPGCYFFTPAMSAHGVAASAIEHHLAQDEVHADAPVRGGDDSLWVMFETLLTLKVMPWHREGANREEDFRRLFEGMPTPFDPHPKV